ncbi:hypothetical protein [Tychonema sp. LEGE 07203]|uniref:hypothetical protein n=1 Tax=Tychonema sp. LEGE 07203 TaxID=1828671 RepID=UPI001880BE27|nr:hypothetical protein [Tychonema sp. LEGE 07203]MBE9094855.1 hypothetical protein [Tychonema sp. LEGE 07203]
MSEFDNFGTAGAKSADRAIGVFAGEADIYNSNENFWSIERCLFNPVQHPVTTSEVFIFSSSCDRHYKALIYR